MSDLFIFSKLPQETNSEYATRILYRNIIDVVLKPGEVLRDNEIAQQLGISRTPVREAFVYLRTQRLVNSFPQSYSCVSKINLDYVDEGIFMRQTLECRILEEVIAKASSSDVAMLGKLIKQQEIHISQNDPAAFNHADYEFHRTLFDIADKPWCFSNMQQITTHHDRIRALVIRLGEGGKEMSIPYQDHCKIYDMILSRTNPPDIRDFMLRHIGYRRLLPDLLEKYPNYFESNPEKDSTKR